jgi:hypothetical protein
LSFWASILRPAGQKNAVAACDNEATLQLWKYYVGCRLVEEIAGTGSNQLKPALDSKMHPAHRSEMRAGCPRSQGVVLRRYCVPNHATVACAVSMLAS